MTTQDDIKEIDGLDPLDEAFDKHGVTADKLIGDEWKIREKLMREADAMIKDMDRPDGDYIWTVVDLIRLKDNIAKTDAEFRRLKGMYNKAPDEVKGTFTLIQEIGKDEQTKTSQTD